jgi:ABC-type uncharacterized transport system permease subunit
MWTYTLFSFVSAACYLIASRLTFRSLVSSTRGPSKHTLLIIIPALLLHVIALINNVGVNAEQNLSMLNVASSLTWLISLTLTLGLIHSTTRSLIPISYTLTAFVVIAAAFLPDHHVLYISARPALLIHIGLAIVAYGAIIVLLLYAGQFAYINYRLKHKQTSILSSSLPPLLEVEAILFKLLTLATLLLALSIGTGFAFLDDMFAQGQVHKTVLSVVALLVLMTTLFGHKILGWRGTPVITSTVVSAFLLTVAYFGSRIVKELILGQF